MAYGIDTVYSQTGDKVKFRTDSEWGGGVALELGGRIMGMVEVGGVVYNATNKQSALNLLDNPTQIFGEFTKPYCLMFEDKVGDSPLGGGVHCIYGHITGNDLYGAQFSLSYPNEVNLVLRVRRKFNGTWSGWKTFSIQ